jgi:hypothetical protein
VAPVCARQRLVLERDDLFEAGERPTQRAAATPQVPRLVWGAGMHQGKVNGVTGTYFPASPKAEFRPSRSYLVREARELENLAA